ncbi:hypothetical protein D7W09_00850 [bacterium D16-34]|nr:hypothetical protein D7W09_00850 [bacterium D16-34]
MKHKKAPYIYVSCVVVLIVAHTKTGQRQNKLMVFALLRFSITGAQLLALRRVEWHAQWACHRCFQIRFKRVLI